MKFNIQKARYRNKKAKHLITMLWLFFGLVGIFSFSKISFASDYIQGEVGYSEIMEEVIAQEFPAEEACVDEKSHCLDATKEKIID